MNKAQEIEERYNKSIEYIRAIEKILRSQETTYDNHVTRLNWLKHLADSSLYLKKIELESANLISEKD